MKLTSKMTVALTLAMMTLGVSGCAVATGTGEETEEQSSAESSAPGAEAKLSKDEGKSDENGSSSSSTGASTPGTPADPLPVPWKALPLVVGKDVPAAFEGRPPRPE
jgi:hypothetical protein